MSKPKVVGLAVVGFGVIGFVLGLFFITWTSPTPVKVGDGGSLYVQSSELNPNDLHATNGWHVANGMEWRLTTPYAKSGIDSVQIQIDGSAKPAVQCSGCLLVIKYHSSAAITLGSSDPSSG